jgi:pimeloyl-ACP methyl ester carboxylesterase
MPGWRVRTLLLFATLVAACAAPPPPEATPFSGEVDLGGRSLFLDCAGTGPVTVVLEAGLGEDSGTWSQLRPAIGPGARVCAYDRANRGESDPGATPRTASDVVDDLAALLDAADIQEPLVLVGHSFGGLAVRLYAARHPGDIAGIVLIDPTPTTFVEDECDILGQAGCAAVTAQLVPDGNPERIDWAASVAELTDAGKLPDVPVVVLTATRHGQGEIRPEEEAVWRRRQEELVGSLPQGRLVVVDSGHFIHLDEPEAVLEVIRLMLEALSASPRAR